jgi:hypothetical protein
MAGGVILTISATLWKELENLAKGVGLQPERVGTLRRRLDDQRARPGRPYTLLIGRPDGGIALLLRRWLGSAVEDALAGAAGRPLVLGPTPDEVQPRIGRWPTQNSMDRFPGHLISLSTDGPPASDTLAQLGSLGTIDQAVLVTRLAQSMSEIERSVAAPTALLAATGKALIVALPGEVQDATDEELRVVANRAQEVLQESNFDGRALAAGLWLADGGEGTARSGVFADLAGFLRVKPAQVEAGREGMTRRALAELIKDLLRAGAARLSAASAPKVRPFPPKDRTRLTEQLGYNLADLGRDVNRRIEERQRAGHPMTEGEVRTFSLNKLEGWTAYLEVEGAWMHEVEARRPGAHQALMKAARDVAGAIHVPASAPVPVPTAPASRTEMGNPAWIDRATAEATRVGIGLVCGLIAYGLMAEILAGIPGGGRPSVALPGIVVAAIGYVALGVGMILGYTVAGRFIGLPVPVKAAGSAPNPAAPLPTEALGPPGWADFQSRMIAWFVRFTSDEDPGDQPAWIANKCLDLAERLDLGESLVNECRAEGERLELLEPIR